MHVVILAGGRGVRLRPYTTAIPKPLVPIGEEYAILDIILQQLRAQGFRRVTLAIGHFLVMNGDVLTDLDYAQLLSDHESTGVPLTVATYQRQVKIDFGTLETSEKEIVSFREKPTLFYSVSMGVYAISRAALMEYPRNVPFGFDDLVLDLLGRRPLPRSYGFDGYWLDIGRPDDYDEANDMFEEVKSRLLPDGGRNSRIAAA